MLHLLPLRHSCQLCQGCFAVRYTVSDVESEPSVCQNDFLMESSTHNHPIQSNNPSPYSLERE